MRGHGEWNTRRRVWRGKREEERQRQLWYRCCRRGETRLPLTEPPVRTLLPTTQLPSTSTLVCVNLHRIYRSITALARSI